MLNKKLIIVSFIVIVAIAIIIAVLLLYIKSQLTATGQNLGLDIHYVPPPDIYGMLFTNETTIPILLVPKFWGKGLVFAKSFIYKSSAPPVLVATDAFVFNSNSSAMAWFNEFYLDSPSSGNPNNVPFTILNKSKSSEEIRVTSIVSAYNSTIYDLAYVKGKYACTSLIVIVSNSTRLGYYTYYNFSRLSYASNYYAHANLSVINNVLGKGIDICLNYLNINST